MSERKEEPRDKNIICVPDRKTEERRETGEGHQSRGPSPVPTIAMEVGCFIGTETLVGSIRRGNLIENPDLDAQSVCASHWEGILGARLGAVGTRSHGKQRFTNQHLVIQDPATAQAKSSEVMNRDVLAVAADNG